MELLCALPDPRVEIFIMKEESLHVFNMEDKPRRMPKGTRLKSWMEGEMVRCVSVPGTALEYALTPNKLVFHETLGMMSVKDLVSKLPGCSRVFGYQDFPANLCPASLKQVKNGIMAIDKAGEGLQPTMASIG